MRRSLNTSNQTANKYTCTMMMMMMLLLMNMIIRLIIITVCSNSLQVRDVNKDPRLKEKDKGLKSSPQESLRTSNSTRLNIAGCST